jgi:hypothetical protein
VAETPPKVVIRTYAPQRAWIIGAGLAAIVLVGGYLLFEYGRSRAGFDQLTALRDRAELRAEIRARDQTIRELRGESAELATLRAGQGQERAELARTIGELQAEVGKLSQQLAFYQGIVVQGANAAEAKVQQLRVVPGSAPGRFLVRFTLVQSGRPDRNIAGRAVLTVEGKRAAAPAVLDMAALSGDPGFELPFSFRYFENLDPEIVIPDGFRPERIIVEVLSSRREVAPVSQTFVWDTDAP